MPSPAASRRNLENARQCGQIKLRRCRDESKIIKSLAWQSQWESDRPPSQRELARRLGVSQPYIHKLLQKARTVGLNQLLKHGCVTFADLEQARSLTARMREGAPELFAPAPQPRPLNTPRVSTADDIQREAQELIRQAHRQNPGAQPRTMRDWHELGRRGGRFPW